MEKASAKDVEPFGYGDDGVDRRGLTDILSASEVSINRYTVEPGSRVSGLHAHMDQEEIFIVVEGEATFETLEGIVTVGEEEIIRFGPGEFQSGKNESSSNVVMYALGSPPDTEDIRIPLECPECDHGNLLPKMRDGEQFLSCPECSFESRVECSECGGKNLHAVLDPDSMEPISLCQDCGAESQPG